MSEAAKGAARRAPSGDRPDECSTVKREGIRFDTDAVYHRILNPEPCYYCFGDVSVEEALRMTEAAGGHLLSTTRVSTFHFRGGAPDE